MKRILYLSLISGVLILMACALLPGSSTAPTRSALSLASERENPVPVTRGGQLEHAHILWNFFFNKPADTRPSSEIPVQRLTREALLAAPDGTLYRLGHSTVLMKLAGAFWLTDPVFSARVSPLPFFGPERFHPAPIGIAELPPIKGVLISHDHYDHLDRDSILQLAGKVETFLTPLGVGEILIGWGVPAAQVRQLDWWQEAQIAGVRLVATPAQHFSGRGLFDKNRTQWASWIILAAGWRLFFSRDSGYFDGFKQIGATYGPFDLTLLETGAYDANWPGVHMQPEESLQAHLDLRGRSLLPIHNGTFDLAMHAWHDPLERAVALGAARQIRVLTPEMGEAVHAQESEPGPHWWASVDRGQGPEQAEVKGQPAAERI